MQTQIAPTIKPLAAIVDKKPVESPQGKPAVKVEKKPKFLRYNMTELQQSLQRKRASRTHLEARIKVLTEKIEAREKRLKELSPKQ